MEGIETGDVERGLPKRVPRSSEDVLGCGMAAERGDASDVAGVAGAVVVAAADVEEELSALLPPEEAAASRGSISMEAAHCWSGLRGASRLRKKSRSHGTGWRAYGVCW